MPDDTPDPRRIQALEQAFEVFLRFGYRKTSMDELARAVGLSRQGLYLWFPNKKALFREMVDHLMAQVDGRVSEALGTAAPLEQRVVDAFDAYVGQLVGTGLRASAMEELMDTAHQLCGELPAQTDARFRRRLADALADAPRTDVSAEELATLLYAVSAGSKFAGDRAFYRERMALAARALLRVEGT